MSFNRFIIMGNLLRDPQIKTLPSGTVVAELGVATNRKFKTGGGEDREEVCFMDATAFGKTAEVIAQYFTKGKPILLEGRIKTDQWEAQDGTKRSKNVMVVENFQFLPGCARDDAPERDEPPAQNRPARQQNAGGQHQGAAANFAARRAAVTGRAPAEAPFGDDQYFQDAEIPFAWEGRRQSMV